jgi:dihydroorotate dehydrogenase
MSIGLYSLAREILFRLEPEHAHELALSTARFLEPLAARLAHRPGAGTTVKQIVGLSFPGPIGLAAGFDKNGIAPHLWEALGFGFAELGTVTARPQPGNPRPRLARFAAERALVNRLGFNNDGAEAVAERLTRLLEVRPSIPIGLNVGASRAVMGDAEAERADYRTSVRLLAPLADYLVVNVSSPNTPGLRDLQSPERLGALVSSVQETLAGLPGAASTRPVLVKLSPDLDDREIAPICEAALGAGAAGFVATNTTLARPSGSERLAAAVGGLSGEPLRLRATEVVRRIRTTVGGGVVIIGVGGVMSVPDALEKLAAGADLVALYSGLIFEGPLLPRRLTRGLVRALGRERPKDSLPPPSYSEPAAGEGETSGTARASRT